MQYLSPFSTTRTPGIHKETGATIFTGLEHCNDWAPIAQHISSCFAITCISQTSTSHPPALSTEARMATSGSCIMDVKTGFACAREWVGEARIRAPVLAENLPQAKPKSSETCSCCMHRSCNAWISTDLQHGSCVINAKLASSWASKEGASHAGTSRMQIRWPMN